MATVRGASGASITDLPTIYLSIFDTYSDKVICCQLLLTCRPNMTLTSIFTLQRLARYGVREGLRADEKFVNNSFISKTEKNKAAVPLLVSTGPPRKIDNAPCLFSEYTRSDTILTSFELWVDSGLNLLAKKILPANWTSHFLRDMGVWLFTTYLLQRALIFLFQKLSTLEIQHFWHHQFHVDLQPAHLTMQKC